MNKSMVSKSKYSKLAQVGVVVRDVNKAKKRFTSFGLGRFGLQVLPPFIGEVYFRGKVWNGKLKPRVGWIGDVEIELLQPVEGSSPHQEFLDSRGEGFHHIALAVDDLDKEVTEFEKKGANVLFDGKWVGGGWAYLDIGLGDFILELIQRGMDVSEIATHGARFSKIIQIGIIVRNLKNAVKRLTSFGLGSFSPLKLPPFVRMPVFRGKEISGTVEASTGLIGDVEIELIQPVEGSSPWQEFLENKGEGIHHIAFVVNDLDREITKLNKKGFYSFSSGRWEGGGGYEYFDVGVGDSIFELLKY